MCTIACCTRSVGHEHRYFKCIRWVYLAHHLVLILFELSLCIAGVVTYNQIYINILTFNILLGAFCPFISTCVGKTPQVCCGTRLCCGCVRQTKYNLKELLQKIDKHIPTDRELSNLTLRASSYFFICEAS